MFAFHVLDELRRFIAVSVIQAHYSYLFPTIEILHEQACIDPPPLLLCGPLSISSVTFLSLVSVSTSFSPHCLKCFKMYLSLCLSPLFLSLSPSSPSLYQAVDWYGDTRLCVFLALPQMGSWQHVRDQNVLYLSCQAFPQDQNGSRPLGAGLARVGGHTRSFFSRVSN